MSSLWRISLHETQAQFFLWCIRKYYVNYNDEKLQSEEPVKLPDGLYDETSDISPQISGYVSLTPRKW